MKLLAVALLAVSAVIAASSNPPAGYQSRTGDCPGYDIWSIYKKYTTLADCASRCNGHSSCKSFMFYDGHECYPKTKTCDVASTSNPKNVFYDKCKYNCLVYNGIQYQGITDQSTWSEQRAACRNIGPGWGLATVATATDFDNMKTHVIGQLKLNNHQIWIGGTDKNCEGKWYWENNLSLINKGQLKLRDSDGLGNKAHENGAEEDCMEMSKEWNGINDRPCGKSYVALCQKY